MTSAATRARIEGTRPDRTTAPADVLGASNADLVRDLKALTHRIHDAPERVTGCACSAFTGNHAIGLVDKLGGRTCDRSAPEAVSAGDLRAQRDAVEAEVLRRMALGWEARA